ncbi:hypothetical protein niasHS_003773 [Heterodera schachtii]|uniref:Uncharacterized protein n=1 Tax=Heterodera schachtii TaxID=97005 RepID=A0ABD2K6A7_HETSC
MMREEQKQQHFLIGGECAGCGEGWRWATEFCFGGPFDDDNALTTNSPPKAIFGCPGNIAEKMLRIARRGLAPPLINHLTNQQNVSHDKKKEMLWDKACLLTRLVASSVRLSEAAGGIIKDIMKSGDLKIVNKDQTGQMKDLQTEADRSAQICIERSLRAKFGENLKIIGEEDIAPPSTPFQTLQPLPSSHHFHIIFNENATTAVPSSEVLSNDQRVPNELRSIEMKDVVVWVDPLDGTSEFTKSKENPALLRQVTVLIGITHKGRPVAGIVHQPYYEGQQTADGLAPNGRTIWSIVGVGTFGHQKTAQQTDGQMPRVAVTTASHHTELVQKALDALVEGKLISEIERVGGAGFKVLRCLEGATAYVFASRGCKKWDTAAPEALLLAAGTFRNYF